MIVPLAPMPETAADIRLYPESDGKPMGETSLHVDAATDWYTALETFFMAAPLVLVLSNVFIYYQEGNPAARRAPDVMVVKGVRKGPRRVFKTWSEGTVPNTVFEVLSQRTWRGDLGIKVKTYARIGIDEYFLFDPEGRYIPEKLIGYRLVGDKYKRMKPEADGNLISKELDLRLQVDGYLIRGIDLKTGNPLPHFKEAYEAARYVMQLEQENQEVRAELGRLRELLRRRDRRAK